MKPEAPLTPEFGPVPLSVAPELGYLTGVEDVRAVAPLSAPGVVARWAESAHIEEAVMKSRLVGRTAGVDMPPWHDGSGGAPVHGVHLCRIPDAALAPEFGAVILRDGRVVHSSVAEALYFTPTLGALPHVTVGEDGPVMAPPAGLPFAERAAVFMAWGGRFNYGHFLLDCLSALTVVAEEGLLPEYPPLAPPLTPWHLALLRLLLGPDAALVRQTRDKLLLTGEVVFASSMDHFLHAPNTPLDRVRARILSAVALPSTGAPRLYLSRRGDDKRRMVNEAELEAALVERGFTIVSPGEMAVDQQIALFRDAEAIVAPTGASLANCLFCKPGARVFEIQPTNFTGIWARAVCHYVEADWHGYFAASPIEETDVFVEGVQRPGTLFEWRTPLPEFLAFLDERL